MKKTFKILCQLIVCIAALTSSFNSASAGNGDQTDETAKPHAKRNYEPPAQHNMTTPSIPVYIPISTSVPMFVPSMARSAVGIASEPAVRLSSVPSAARPAVFTLLPALPQNTSDTAVMGRTRKTPRTELEHSSAESTARLSVPSAAEPSPKRRRTKSTTSARSKTPRIQYSILGMQPRWEEALKQNKPAARFFWFDPDDLRIPGSSAAFNMILENKDVTKIKVPKEVPKSELVRPSVAILLDNDAARNALIQHYIEKGLTRQAQLLVDNPKENHFLIWYEDLEALYEKGVALYTEASPHSISWHTWARDMCWDSTVQVRGWTNRKEFKLKSKESSIDSLIDAVNSARRDLREGSENMGKLDIAWYCRHTMFYTDSFEMNACEYALVVCNIHDIDSYLKCSQGNPSLEERLYNGHLTGQKKKTIIKLIEIQREETKLLFENLRENAEPIISEELQNIKKFIEQQNVTLKPIKGCIIESASPCPEIWQRIKSLTDEQIIPALTKIEGLDVVEAQTKKVIQRLKELEEQKSKQIDLLFVIQKKRIKIQDTVLWNVFDTIFLA